MPCVSHVSAKNKRRARGQREHHRGRPGCRASINSRAYWRWPIGFRPEGRPAACKLSSIRECHEDGKRLLVLVWPEMTPGEVDVACGLTRDKDKALIPSDAAADWRGRRTSDAAFATKQGWEQERKLISQPSHATQKRRVT